ncbi:hypothetical protein LCGC14_0095070 [marine sediment metagenome]|uniref:Glycosyltransferase RgtA/B/C/D-like domain-containing protein n=1 Tax=marine sediment metagenome TaxID=412755 RepID=A0A0F9VHM7_9ZZZZ|nr:hypothetical protein [Phycisphaerae bacterium]
MTRSAVNLDQTPLPGPTRYDALGWVFVLGGLALSAVLSVFSDGIYMNDDATHYMIARDGWGDLSILLHRWGRVGYTVPTSPVAYWFGFGGCRLFSGVQTALIALLAWRTARRLIGPGLLAALAALCVWLQPLTFRLSLTTLTETTGAFYMMLAIFLYLRGNRLFACVAFSALFLARDETMALAPLVGVALIMDAYRQAGGRWRTALAARWMWGGFALLAAGPVLYVLASIPVDLPPHGDPLAIFTRRYTIEFGTGPLYWMAARWSEQATPLILSLGLLGLGLLIRSLWRRERLCRQAGSVCGAWLLPAWTLGYLALHSVLFNRGLFAHGGAGRLMVPLTGLLGVQAAIGLRGVLADRRGRIILAFAALLAGTICLPLVTFAYLVDFLSSPLRNGLLVGLLGAVALTGLLMWRKQRVLRRVAIMGLLPIAAALMLGQFQIYCRPLSLDNPVDPMDKPLGQAARFVRQADLDGRTLIAKHPLIALLLPETQMPLPETQLRVGEKGAIQLWQESPAGTLFFWDSKNCTWPDLIERKSSQELRDMLDSQAAVRAHFITDDYIPGKKCEVIIFEKLPPPPPTER